MKGGVVIWNKNNAKLHVLFGIAVFIVIFIIGCVKFFRDKKRKYAYIIWLVAIFAGIWISGNQLLNVIKGATIYSTKDTLKNFRHAFGSSGDTELIDKRLNYLEEGVSEELNEIDRELNRR